MINKDKTIRIIAFGDSHGSEKALDVIESALKKDDYQYIIFAGDGLSHAQERLAAYKKKLIGVKGNCDILPSAQGIIIKKIGKVKILITHGHMFDVNSGLDELVRYAHEEGAGLVVYGHTHISGVEDYQGVTFVNPGSIPKPLGFAPSYAEISIKGEQINAHIINL